MLKLPLCKDARADPILPGLGSGFSFESPLTSIFLGREKSLTLDFSALAGFSGIVSGGRYGDAPCCVCSVVGKFGEDCGDALGNTTFAAAVAADDPSSPL